MTSFDSTLETLRKEIDRIDDRIHDLIMARSALVERIGSLKGNDPVVLRPGREAEILRRLMDRHTGSFPKAAIVRIWREIIGALVGVQKPMTIAIVQSDEVSGYVELGRNHFGVVWPVVTAPSAGQVVTLVAEDKASVGIVPLPDRAGNVEAWWAALATEREGMPRIVTRLPIYPAVSAGHAESLEAFVLARRMHDDTGSDRSLLVIETDSDTSRDRLRSLLTQAKFEPIETLATHSVAGTSRHLVEVDGWCGPSDRRLAALHRDPVRHASVVGGYPVLLSP